MRLFYLSLIAVFLVSCRLISSQSEPLTSTPATGFAGIDLSLTSAPETLAPVDVRTTPSSEVIQVPVEAKLPTSGLVSPSLPSIRQLSYGGCCVDPFWSLDSRHILYYDRPTSADPVGIWGIPVEGGPPQFITSEWGILSKDQSLRAFLADGKTYVERRSDGTRWVIPNGGRSVVFSPDGSQVAWITGQTQPPFDSSQRQVWISLVDGSQTKSVMSALSAGISGWLPDGSLVINGRLDSIEKGQALWIVSPPREASGEWMSTELVRGNRIRGASISTGGSWLAYISAFSGDLPQDGIWLMNSGSREKYKLDVFGAYQWQDDNNLLVIPLELNQESHRILRVKPAIRIVEELTNPASNAFKIANGDWEISLDGKHLAFVSARDGNIWVMDLPAD